MRELLLDASVVMRWFRTDGERNVDAARALRAEYESGALRVVAPRLLRLELLSLAGGALGLTGRNLERVAAALDAIGFDYRDPPLGEVASWIGRGLTAHDATYAAVASSADLRLVTDDPRLLANAAEVAIPLTA
jgi:predicted nucleic acid-binding protein